MKAYTIHAIREKARRTGYGQEYIDDCKALAETWNVEQDRATFRDAVVRELKDTWPTGTAVAQSPAGPCAECGA